MEPIYDIVWIFSKVFVVQTFLCIALPAFALWPVLRGRSVVNTLAVSSVVGHFTLVQLVFLLGFLRLCYRPLFIVLVLGLAIAVRLFLQRRELKKRLRSLGGTTGHLLGHEYGARLFVKRQRKEGWRSVKALGRRVAPHLPELLALGLFTALVIGFYMNWGIHYTSFAAPDEEVHLYYIQQLLDGDIYTSGVYPFGFHNTGAAVILFSGIRTVDFIRVACLVSLVYIMGGLYLWLRQLFRFRLGIIVAVAVYNLGLFYSLGATTRYQYALPQEYGMVFLCPMPMFFAAYMRHKRRRDLLLFGASFSLVFACHFYTAIIAGLACLALGLVYLGRIFRRRLVLPLVASVLGFMLVAVLPIGVGRLMGKPWEQAMGWAVGVLNDEDIYDETGISRQGTAAAGMFAEDTPQNLDGQAYTGLRDRLAGIYTVFSQDMFYSRGTLLLFCAMLPFAAGYTVYCLVKRKRSGQGQQLLGMWVLGLLLGVMACAKPLGLPTIMDANRLAIFFAYFTAWVIAAPLELLYLGLKNRPAIQKKLPATVCACLCAAMLAQQVTGQFRRTSLASPIQTRPAMQCTLRIMDTYEPYSYTIVSPTQETGMVLGSGYHYELIDLLLEQEFYREDMEVYIPTPHVFVYVEKLPLYFFGWNMAVTMPYEEYIDREGISPEYADAYFITEQEPSDYYKNQRFTVMSRADAWIQKYRQHHAASISVYYEDAEMVVYHITQNEYALNNLALDYGYNSRLSS